MQIIPAIDLLDGNVVRLKKGAYNDVTSYTRDPIEQALIYRNAGFNHIHIVDLNGAKEGRFFNLPIITEIIKKTNLTVQSGGGIRDYDDCQRLFDAGISKIVSSSMAVTNKKDWIRALHNFSGKCCILGMDLKNNQIAYAGWTRTSGESPDDFLKNMIDEGMEEVLCTDISRDGMLSGVNIPLYQNLMKKFPELRFIASGGVSGEKDLIDLDSIDIYAVVIGRAYYEGYLDISVMKAYHKMK